MGSLVWSWVPAVGPWLCRGQPPTRWHCWSRVWLPDSAISAGTWECFGMLPSIPMGCAGPGCSQGETHWEPPSGLSNSRRPWDVCQG